MIGVAVDSSVVVEIVAGLQRELPGLAIDGWRPSVQGAVGHVAVSTTRAEPATS